MPAGWGEEGGDGMSAKFKLSKRALLFLRLIEASPHNCWCPGDKWVAEAIPDGSGDYVPHIGGGGDTRILQSLIDKGLIFRRDRSHDWCFLQATPEGKALVAQRGPWKRDYTPLRKTTP